MCLLASLVEFFHLRANTKLIQEKRKMLSSMTQQDKDGSLGVEINKVKKEINGLLDDKEIY